jgi:hypothetical protein
MNTQSDYQAVSKMRHELEHSGLSAGTWVLDEIEHDRPCLMRVEGGWVAGYSERGHFYEEFRETDSAEALRRFVSWVEAGNASTQESAEATERWLKRNGQSRP